MGLFNKLFGQSDSTEVCIEWGMRLCDEIERVYRNHVHPVAPTGIGLLKARLLASCFVHTAYLFGCARGEEDAEQFFVACSGIAMRPFNQSGFSPSISREQASSFATDFMLKGSRAIRSELKDGPSTVTRETQHFD